jgi:hypothetical protein
VGVLVDKVAPEGAFLLEVRYSAFNIIPSIFHNIISFIFFQRYNLLFLWRFDPIPGLGLPLRGFANTNIGHPTLGRNPDGDQPDAEIST